MQYRNLGRSGLKVSSLCVGTMTWGATTDEAEAVRIVDAALDGGVNFFDTAHVYNAGRSEEMLGRALARDGKRDSAVVSTKFSAYVGRGPNDGGSSRYHVVRACDASLRRLGTDRTDLYYAHFMDLGTPLDEILMAMDDLVRAGKVRYIGTSKWAPSLLAEAILTNTHFGRARFVAEQPAYNLLDRGVENELLWTALRHGVGLVPFAPLASGILSGQYKSPEDRPAGSRNEAGGIGEARLNEPALERVRALEALAQARGISVAQFALAWIHQQPGVTAPILGVRKLDHLTSALEALDLSLTPEELTRVDEISPPGSAVSDYWAGRTLGPLRSAALKRR